MKWKRDFPSLSDQIFKYTWLQFIYTSLRNVDISRESSYTSKAPCVQLIQNPLDKHPSSSASAASSVSPSSIILLSSSQYLRQRHHLQPSSPTLHDISHHLLFQKTFSPISVQPRTQPPRPGHTSSQLVITHLVRSSDTLLFLRKLILLGIMRNEMEESALGF